MTYQSLQTYGHMSILIVSFNPDQIQTDMILIEPIPIRQDRPRTKENNIQEKNKIRVQPVSVICLFVLSWKIDQ